MFGAIYGDVIGSYYETHCTKDYNFEFQRESTFTDDSVLIAAVCKTILNDPSEVTKFGLRKRAQKYAAQYRQYYSYFPQQDSGICLQNGQELHLPKTDTATQTVPLCG